jgi:predicted naringenin-chalcone synthase
MALIYALLGGLLTVAGSMTGRVLIALGMSYFTYSGFNLGADWLLLQVKSSMGAMPADVLSFLGWLWVDKGLSMIFSAYVVALSFKTVGGNLTKLVTRGPK